MSCRRLEASWRMRSRLVLNSSPCRYSRPRLTLSSARRSAIISAELRLKFLSSATPEPPISATYILTLAEGMRRFLPGPHRRSFRGPPHVSEQDAPAGARAFHPGKVYAQFL